MNYQRIFSLSFCCGSAMLWFLAGMRSYENNNKCRDLCLGAIILALLAIAIKL